MNFIEKMFPLNKKKNKTVSHSRYQRIKKQDHCLILLCEYENILDLYSSIIRTK